MNFRDTLPKELSFLYSRALDEIGFIDDTNEGPAPLARSVLRAHFSIAEFFAAEGEGIGGFGPMDTSVLMSAIGRIDVGYGGKLKWNTVHEKAATLLFGLVMNHSFHDANKRTAFLSTVHYLFEHGYMLTVSEKEFEDVTVLVADHGLGKFKRFQSLKKKSQDPEVLFLAHYLKTNTRRLDRREYFVTYRELESILKRYDVWLEYPRNNQIDVMRWEQVTTKKGFFGKSVTSPEARRVCVLGFPGWTKQVGKGRISYIRKELNLTIEHGIDSQSFFKNVDDMRGLLSVYEGALRRLAHR